MASLMILTALGTSSCNGKKKRAEEERARQEALAAAEREAYLNGIRRQLDGIINYSARDFSDLAAKEAELRDIESLEDWQESDILLQIRKARFHLQEERDRLQKAADQASSQPQPQRPAPNTPEGRAMAALEQAFSEVSNATTTAQANAAIQRAQSLFSSENAPVLIIISQAGDFDRPTTIARYLNYLKDQQRNPNVVEKIVLDNQGRITELELIKSQLRP